MKPSGRYFPPSISPLRVFWKVNEKKKLEGSHISLRDSEQGGCLVHILPSPSSQILSAFIPPSRHFQCPSSPSRHFLPSQPQPHTQALSYMYVERGMRKEPGCKATHHHLQTFPTFLLSNQISRRESQGPPPFPGIKPCIHIPVVLILHKLTLVNIT